MQKPRSSGMLGFLSSPFSAAIKTVRHRVTNINVRSQLNSHSHVVCVLVLAQMKQVLVSPGPSGPLPYELGPSKQHTGRHKGARW